ncbi:MAG: serpin family protein [Planctomycetales bacterium]
MQTPPVVTRPQGQPAFWLVLIMLVLVGAVLFRSRSASQTGGQDEIDASPVNRSSSKATGGIVPSLGPARSRSSAHSAAKRREAAIYRALEKTVTVVADRQPLDELVRDLAGQIEVPLEFDRQSLIDEGVSLNQPITAQFADVTARSALELILEPLVLDWAVRNEVLLIMTAFQAATFVETRLYEVADLIAVRDSNGLSSHDFTSLIDVLTWTVAPDSWEEMGGPGSVHEFHSGGIRALSVLQTYRNHEWVAELLADLRKQPRQADTVIPVQTPASPRARKRPPATPAIYQFDDLRTDALVRGNNQFALELYAQLAGESRDNLFVSPFSISLTMAMVYAGARGETAREMAAALHFLVRQEDLPETWSRRPVFQRMLKVGGALMGSFPDGIDLRLGNRIWGNKGIEFLESFSDTLAREFHAHLETVDFADAEAAAKAINDWIKSETDGLIPQIVTADDLSDATDLVLTNAISFNGKWSVPFARQATRPALFYSRDARTEVPLMHLDSEACRYAEIDGLQVLEKEYGDNRGVSMVILLPERNATSVAELEAALTENNVTRWLAALDDARPEIFLPRFNVESSFSLRTLLESRGMRSAFHLHDADFSGMIGTGNLALSEVIHKASVEVDEQGTRAMAATAGTGVFGKPDTRPVFRADHPFVFLIRDRQTGSILFLGRLVNPRASR